MTQTQHICSFCGKSQSMVGHIIVGPEVNICNECVDMCTMVIQREMSLKETLTPVSDKDPTEAELDVEDESLLDFMPSSKEIKDSLELHIIGQDKAKKFISVAVYNHYKRIVGQTDQYEDTELQKVIISYVLVLPELVKP